MMGTNRRHTCALLDRLRRRDVPRRDRLGQHDWISRRSSLKHRRGGVWLLCKRDAGRPEQGRGARLPSPFWSPPSLSVWSRTTIRTKAIPNHCPHWVCAVRRRRFPVGVRPTRRPLQPEATGAAMEVTK